VVVVCKWPGHGDSRSLLENGWIKEAKQQGDLGHLPQKTGRAVRVPVVFTLRLFALTTAYRLPGEPEVTGEEPVGWHRWRRQLLQRTRDKVIVCAQYGYGIFHVAEDSRLLGVKLKQLPPGIETHQELLAKNGLRLYKKIWHLSNSS